MRHPLRPALLPAVAVLALGVLAGCGSEDPEPTASDTTTSSSAPAPSSSAPASGTTEDADTPSADPGDAVVPVYFVGDTPMGPRLYREFHQVDPDAALTEAAELLFSGAALDPDYRSLLPDITIESVEDEDGFLVVHLGEDAPAADKGTSAQEGRLAVQSLVYTLQGASQTREPVKVVTGPDDVPVTLLGVDTTDGVEAAAPLDVLSLVNVTEPEQAATVSGTFTASGVSSSFEATTPWRIVDGDGKTVLDGFATAEGWMDRLYPWETDVDVSSLAPGGYTFIAATDDPSGGEGPGPFEDSKDITVE